MHCLIVHKNWTINFSHVHHDQNKLFHICNYVFCTFKHNPKGTINVATSACLRQSVWFPPAYVQFSSQFFGNIGLKKLPHKVFCHKLNVINLIIYCRSELCNRYFPILHTFAGFIFWWPGNVQKCFNLFRWLFHICLIKLLLVQYIGRIQM